MPGDSLEATAVITAESTPLERKLPSGTSESICDATEFSTASRSRSFFSA